MWFRPAPPRIAQRGRLARRLGLAAAAIGLAVAAAWSTAVVIRPWLSDGGSDDQHESVQTESSADSPRPTFDSVVVMSLADERALLQDYRNVEDRISQIERTWSQSAIGGDGLEATVSELDRRLDDLRRRIDRNLP